MSRKNVEKTLEKLKRLNGSFLRLKSWRSEEADSDQLHFNSLELIDAKDAGEDDFFSAGYLGGSDYSGSMVERSNHKVFMEEFGEENGVVDAYGSHGSFGVLVRVKDASDEILERLDGLDTYPVMDDDAHGAAEIEAQEEAWEAWAKSDFVRALHKKFDDDADDASDAIDALTDGQIREIFDEAVEYSAAYWQDETGGNMHIDIGRVVSKGKIRLKDILEMANDGDDEDGDAEPNPRSLETQISELEEELRRLRRQRAECSGVSHIGNIESAIRRKKAELARERGR